MIKVEVYEYGRWIQKEGTKQLELTFDWPRVKSSTLANLMMGFAGKEIVKFTPDYRQFLMEDGRIFFLVLTEFEAPRWPTRQGDEITDETIEAIIAKTIADRDAVKEELKMKGVVCCSCGEQATEYFEDNEEHPCCGGLMCVLHIGEN